LPAKGCIPKSNVAESPRICSAVKESGGKASTLHQTVGADSLFVLGRYWMLALAGRRHDSNLGEGGSKPEAPDAQNTPSEQFLSRARERLIVALDFDTVTEAKVLVEQLGDEVEFYKVGLGLQLDGGDQFARWLKEKNKRVFLDYKYYDIGETIKRAVSRAADFGVDFLTVHGVTGIFESAVAGRGKSDLKILCVTVLTTMDAKDIQEMGFPTNMSVEDLVVHRARNAFKAGFDGVIASANEVVQLKKEFSNKLLIVTPAIRPLGSSPDDQKRIATPFEAVKSGADYLVIGRPITKANNPVEAAHSVVLEMANGQLAASNPSTGATQDAVAPHP
jgi:orotidine-5'-phosphate decarboxylase